MKHKENAQQRRKKDYREIDYALENTLYYIEAYGYKSIA